MQKMLIPIKREVGVTWDGGTSFARDVKEFDLRGVIIPFTGRELLLVPESDRYKYPVWIFTEGDIRDNDIVTFNDQAYAVQNVEPWFWFKRARAMRIDVGPERAAARNAD